MANDAQQPARSRWRFSIRELLLLTTTIAAVAAFVADQYRKTLPFHPTKLAAEFGQYDHIRHLLNHIQPSRLVDSSGNTSDALIEREYLIELPQTLHKELLERLNNDALEMLKKDGCKVRGHGRGRGDELIQTFQVKYSRQGMRGIVVFRLVRRSDDLAALFILIYEQADR